jgi:hypothetical protein
MNNHKTYKTLKMASLVEESTPIIPNLIRNGGFPAATRLRSRPHQNEVLKVL